MKNTLNKSREITNTADCSTHVPHERVKEGNMIELIELAAKYERANATKFFNIIHQ